MTERKKQFLAFGLPIIFCLTGIILISVFGLNLYQKSAFEHLSKFCELLIQNNPEAEQQILSSVKEYLVSPREHSNETFFLTRYGYKSTQFYNGTVTNFFILSSIIFVMISGCFLVSLWWMNRRKKLRISELTDYLERINIGKEKIVIHTKEDEFSGLQDEIYKTVTQLIYTREAALKSKNNFADNLANIAHQLKTPVTAASLSLQLIQNEMPDLRTKQIKKQLERLSVLEEALLTLSKIDAGTLPFEYSKVDIYTALTLAADNLSNLLQKEGVSILIPDKGCVEITGDMEWTMEAFLNLLKNCMEHSTQNGTIHCDYSTNPIYSEILIWDEGEGFYPDDIPHLFERFYRGKNASSNGIGIGLALAKSIFELQNGNITARNLPDGGACFEIRIYSH